MCVCVRYVSDVRHVTSMNFSFFLCKTDLHSRCKYTELFSNYWTINKRYQLIIVINTKVYIMYI